MPVEDGGGAAKKTRAKAAPAPAPPRQPSPFARHPADPPPAHQPQPLTPAVRDSQLRAAILVWANELLGPLRGRCHYTEGPERLSMYHMAPGDPGDGPITADCSSSVSGLYKWAGAPDPNRLDYGGDPFTGTLLEAMRPIGVAQVKPGDLIVYGPGSGEHVALVLERIGSGDFWLFNNGGPDGAPPSRVRHSGNVAWFAAHGSDVVRCLASLL